MDYLALLSLPISGNLLIILGAVVLFFVVSAVILMAILFGWSMKDSIRNGTMITVLAALLLGSPLIALNMYRVSMASQQSDVLITQIDRIDVDSRTVTLNIKTALPATVYLEYRDGDGVTHMIPPSLGDEKRIDHSFTIRKTGEGGTVTAIIDGRRSLIGGQPYELD